ncbi:MAG: hypothetical protein EXR73_05675 [Myxococcales bacterium]|nr:hypothetical protein [Myxococcales bacterium]
MSRTGHAAVAGLVAAVVAVGLLFGAPTLARADVAPERVETSGYLRIMTRPDFQGGNSRLGFWNLYGRLLNEGPWVTLGLRLNILPRDPVTREAWTSVVARIEGGSIANVDPRMGRLDALALNQLYVQAGNVLLEDVTWQVGTLEYYLGDLSLYDLRVAQIFFETVGASARWQTPRVDLVVGAGDSGYALRGDRYSTVFTVGGLARVRLGGQLELGLGGQLGVEPEVEGNRFAPHATPEVDYEDWLRGEVAERWLDAHPGEAQNFPHPVATSSASWKLIGYLGFGKLGALRWNNLYTSVERLHPEGFTSELVDGQGFDLYVKELTDERFRLLVGDEAHFTLVPGRLELLWGGLVGVHWDGDNRIAPGDHNRRYASTVLRLQLQVGERAALLAETSLAHEQSTEGNRYRRYGDSVFQSSGGISDARGLEFGDTAERTTWQGKAGWVLAPLGAGVFSRPALRLLYGVQHSSQTNAFGNSFVESLDQSNLFGSPDQHWHHVLAVEAEAWF